MDESNPADELTDGRRRKVVRLLDEFDMEGLGADLERRWTASEDHWSLRELATYFNKQLLDRTLHSVNVRTLDGEVDNIYRLLTGDDVTSVDRTRIRRRLEREEVDVDQLEKNFVTY
jgi:hypothetical protein